MAIIGRIATLIWQWCCAESVGIFIDTKLAMAGIAFDVMLETGVLVQAFPVWSDDLAHPERFVNPGLIRHIAAEGIGIG